MRAGYEQQIRASGGVRPGQHRRLEHVVRFPRQLHRAGEAIVMTAVDTDDIELGITYPDGHTVGFLPR